MGDGCIRLSNSPERCLGTARTWGIADQSTSGKDEKVINEAHLVVNVVPIVNTGRRGWQGILLRIVAHVVGLRVPCDVTWVMGGVRILVDGRDG